MTPQQVAGLLGADGPFAADAGFVARPQQQLLAETIAHAIADGQDLVAEAGTGTGKTFAYLVPALASGKRVIVSTGTKALQDQLFHRDLPRVRKRLQSSVDIALLKGRSNYLCLHRLERTLVEARFDSREQVAQLAKVRSWAARTASGDRMEHSDIPEDAAIWPLVTSTSENCLGSKCEHFDSCWLVKARRKAMEADLVVVNHALLMADMAVRQEGFGEVLPGAHVFIIDEAHQLPEVASQHFGQHFSARQLTELARDTLMEASSQSGAMASVMAPVEALQLAVKKLRLALDGFPVKGALASIEHDAQVLGGLDEMDGALEALDPILAGLAKASEGLGHCAERVVELRRRLAEIRDPGRHDLVRWYELSTHGFALHITPLDVSGPLAAYRGQTGARWILTSATLAVGEHFHHFQRETGLYDARTLKVDSPFDYPNQALLYLPRGLPEPNDPGYGAAVVRAALPMLRASRGRAFFLFTSHRALRDAATQLGFELEYPLFVQGTLPRGELLRQFIASGNGVLLGAASFWEGVDVPGEALQLVIIDKLPFAQIGDPVMEARLQAIRDRGGQPFPEYQLPTAVLALKQGAGRLIRTVSDRGVLMLCDPRLRSKSYGRVFLDSLPPMPRTHSEEAAAAFYALGAG